MPRPLPLRTWRLVNVGGEEKEEEEELGSLFCELFVEDRMKVDR